MIVLWLVVWCATAHTALEETAFVHLGRDERAKEGKQVVVGGEKKTFVRTTVVKSAPPERPPPFSSQESDVQKDAPFAPSLVKAESLERELQELSERLSLESLRKTAARVSLKGTAAAAELAALELATLEARVRRVEDALQEATLKLQTRGDAVKEAEERATRLDAQAERALQRRDFFAAKERAFFERFEDTQTKLLTFSRGELKRVETLSAFLRDGEGLHALMASSQSKIERSFRAFRHRIHRLQNRTVAALPWSLTKSDLSLQTKEQVNFLLVVGGLLGHFAVLKDLTAAHQALYEAKADLHRAKGDLVLEHKLSEFAYSAAHRTDLVLEDATRRLQTEIARLSDHLAKVTAKVTAPSSTKKGRRLLPARSSKLLLVLVGVCSGAGVAAKKALDVLSRTVPADSAKSNVLPAGTFFGAVSSTKEGLSFAGGPPPPALSALVPVLDDGYSSFPPPPDYDGGSGGGGSGGGGDDSWGGPSSFSRGAGGLPPPAGLIEAAPTSNIPQQQHRRGGRATPRSAAAFSRPHDKEGFLHVADRTLHAGDGLVQQMAAKAATAAAALASAGSADDQDVVVDCGARFERLEAAKRTMDAQRVTKALLRTTQSSDDRRFARVGTADHVCFFGGFHNSSVAAVDVAGDVDVRDCASTGLPLVVRSPRHLIEGGDVDVVLDLAGGDAALWPRLLPAFLERWVPHGYVLAPTALLRDPACADALRDVGPQRLLWASDVPLDDRRRYGRNLQAAKDALALLFPNDPLQAQRSVLATNALALFFPSPTSTPKAEAA